MATIDLSKATKKAPVDTSTLQTHLSIPGAGSGAPVAGGFAPVVTAKPANDYTTPSFATVPGPYDPLRDQLKAANPNIPASFIDDEVDNFNKNRTRGGTLINGTADISNPQVVQYLSTQVQHEWGNEPDRARYTKTDADAKAAQDLNNTTFGANRASDQITKNEQQAVGGFYDKYVLPSYGNVQTTQAAQVTGDRAAEDRVNAATTDYNSTLDTNQALRMAGIGTTNSQLTDLANQYRGATDSTNASNSQFASQFLPVAQQANDANSGLAAGLWNATNSTNAANNALGSQLSQAAMSTNANQIGLYNTLAGQASSINANQTGLYNTLAGQAQSINSNQTDLFNELAGQAQQSNAALDNANSYFQSQLGQLNDQQNSANDLFQGQLSNLNSLDQSSLGRYMAETDPMMAAMHAQGSDPADVARQQDVINRYEELSHPQVTDQERLVAELARRKFESDDQSNREALMQQLRGRGLQSGGLVIAGLQSANQQTANDRQMAELGLNAQAQNRAMQGMAGYSDASNVLRNADDAMRNFQDQYAQNDAVRRGNLSNQREAMNLAETNQETGRDTTGFNATTTTLNNNTQRDALGFDANRNTINDNYNRDESVFNAGTLTNNNNWTRDQGVFDAGTTTNNNNFSRDQSVFNAGTQTNEDNFGRTDTAIANQEWVNQGNLQNTQFATTNSQGVNNDNASRLRNALQDNINTNQTNLGNTGTGIGVQMGTVSGNDTRYQAGLDSGNTTAKNKLDATGAAATFGTNNLGSEAQTAQSAASTLGNAGVSFSNTQSGMSKEQQDAIDKILGRGQYAAAVKAV